jgi:HAD superfamily hydrolase (TIGR01509 family)
MATDPPRRGLLLDFDGTLANSIAVMRNTYEHFLAAHHAVGSEPEFQSLNGPPLREVVRWLRERHRLPQPLDELHREYQRMLAEAYKMIQPSTGARELLAAAQARHYHAAVVTSADSATVRAWLTRHELQQFVAGVVGSDTVSRGKPHPEPYNQALCLLGCEARDAFAIEDSPIGAKAAVAAGLRTYVLLHSATSHRTWPHVAGFIEELSAAIDLLVD